MTALRWIVAATLLLSACGKQPEGRPSSVSQRRAELEPPPELVAPSSAPLIQPYILLVTGPKHCLEAKSDIKAIVDKDALHVATELKLRFNETIAEALGPPGETGTHLPNPSSSELKATLEKLVEEDRLAAGLVLLYSGHGTTVKTDAGERSRLCLENGAFDVTNVMQWVKRVPTQRLPWIGIILNACKSAYVDISGASRPIGVLAASQEPVTVHAFPRADEKAGSCRPRRAAGKLEVTATPLVVATAAALRSPDDPNHDRNEDGIVTLHELLHVWNDAAQEGWRDCEPRRPAPRLQLQARSDIPIRFHQEAVDTVENIRGIVRKLENGPKSLIQRGLVSALNAQLNLARERRLPKIQWDFVISKGMHAANEMEIRKRIPSFEQPGVRPTTCWAHPVHLSQAPRALDLEEQLALARFSIFTTFYELRPNGPSIDIVRPHERKLSRAPISHAAPLRQAIAEIPPRIDNVTDLVYRAMTEIPRADTCVHTALHPVLGKRNFEVCREEEGQCFTAIP